ncbi:FAD-binding oxidoreductase [PVC group bacterium]|nr:FAD-binding oxidoreductase [PVC group bacterium]
MDNHFTKALKEWQDVVGSVHASIHPEELKTFQNTTFQTDQKVLAVIKPGTRKEVEKCVRIANTYKIPLYPVSTGKNWGYGSGVPTGPNNVILYLGRMNRIIDYHENLAYVTVEPGVTQKDLYQYLIEQQSNLFMDVTGASESCSLIGNAVERGFGHTPYGDHFSFVCGFEVVLPTGEVIQTGLSHFRNAKASPVYRWGVGPFLDGLFSQSNLGIVTRMTFWLMPKPEQFEAFYCRVDSEKKLALIIDQLRPLRLSGILRSAVHIGNDYKVLNTFQRYPWDETNGQFPLKPQEMKKIAKKHKIGAWNVSGALYGTRCDVIQAKRKVSKALNGVGDKLVFLNDSKISFFQTCLKLIPWLKNSHLFRQLEILKPIYGLNLGIPTDTMMKSVYWRKKGDIENPMDPDRDRCGLIWLSAVAPLEGCHAQEIFQITKDILLEYKFEPMISVTMITERAMDFIISIVYDRDTPGQDLAAMNCHDKLLGYLTDEGYYPYRLGIQNMSKIKSHNPNYTDMLKKIKTVLDPNGIISPGRYEL